MKYIAPMMVGGVIGYFTNWLAIKMLFRPYEEKRVLGLKIPFTPGLIPKERYRMSKSIGNAIGEHLLTPEKIKEVLSSEETQININKWISLKLKKLKESEQSIMDLLSPIIGSNYNKTIYIIEENIVETIISKLKNKDFKIKIINFIDNSLYEKYKDLALDKLDIKVRDVLREVSQSSEVKSLIVGELQDIVEKLKDYDRALKEVVSQNTIDNIYRILDENEEYIINGVKSLLNNEDLKYKLKVSIEDLINENVSKLITMFLEPQIISDKVFHIIERYINSSDGEKVILFATKSSLDRFLEAKISTIAHGANRFIVEENIMDIRDLILNYLSQEENQNKIIDVFIKNIKSKDMEIKGEILNIISINLEKIVDSAEFKDSILKIVNININRLLNKPLCKILNNINEEKVSKTTNFIKEMLNTYSENALLEIINLFDISKIVEEQINSFQVEYTEELILGIAEKELKAITRLGALLGGIMGLLSPLLQNIV